MGGRGCAPIGRSSSGAVGAAVRWRARPPMKTLIAASDAGRENATDLQTRGSRDGSGLFDREPGETATRRDVERRRVSRGFPEKTQRTPFPSREDHAVGGAVRCDPRPRERRPPWPTKPADPGNTPRPDAHPARRRTNLARRRMGRSGTATPPCVGDYCWALASAARNTDLAWISHPWS